MSEDNTPSDGAQGGKTIIYGFAREAITKHDLVTLKEALEAEGYVLTTSSGNIMVKRQDEGSAVDLEDVLG